MRFATAALVAILFAVCVSFASGANSGRPEPPPRPNKWLTDKRNEWRSRYLAERKISRRLHWALRARARAHCLRSCLFYPLPMAGRIIGVPYSGTHTLGNWQSDNAIDIAVPYGTPVFSPVDGVIGGRIGSSGRGGRFAGMRLTVTGSGNSYFMTHLSRLYVRAGQHVVAGELVGLSGRAGVAHLHLSQRRGDPRSTFRW